MEKSLIYLYQHDSFDHHKRYWNQYPLSQSTVKCKSIAKHFVSKTILEYLYPWLQRLNEARPPRPGYATMGYFVERLNRKD